jgi:hypothetical protein
VLFGAPKGKYFVQGIGGSGRVSDVHFTILYAMLMPSSEGERQDTYSCALPPLSHRPSHEGWQGQSVHLKHDPCNKSADLQDAKALLEELGGEPATSSVLHNAPRRLTRHHPRLSPSTSFRTLSITYAMMGLRMRRQPDALCLLRQVEAIM